MGLKLKKISTISAIVCLSIAALIGISLLFKLFVINGVIGSILLTLLTFFVASIFLLTSSDLLDKKKYYGILSTSLILLSSVLFLILIWYSIPTGNEVNIIFVRIAVTISALSLLFNLIFGSLLSLGKSLLVIQIIDDLCFIFIEVILVLLAYDVNTFENDFMSTIFFAVAIIFVVLYVIIKIKSRNKKEKPNMISISIQEYESLKSRIIELEEKLNEKE